MTLSQPSLLKKFALPYGLLLLLYVLVVGIGTIVLLQQARQTQADNIVQSLLTQLEPIVRDLRSNDALAWLRQEDGQATPGVQALYEAFPTLRQIAIQDQRGGFGWQMRMQEQPQLEIFELPPLTTGPYIEQQSLARRLYAEQDPIFQVYFPLTETDDVPLQSIFGFTRSDLLIAIENELSPLKQVIGLFGTVGFFSILIAFAVSLYMAGSVRKMEAQLQTVYRHSNLAVLAAGLVHDIRNRMHSIRVNIKNVLIVPAETPQVIDEVEQDIVQLEQVLAQFLDTTRLRDEPFSRVDIVEPVSEAARLIEPKLQQHQVKLHTDIPTGLQVITMPQSLTGALLELLTNACEASSSGSDIWLRITKRKKNWIVISVADNGEGIDDSVREQMFEPFVTTKTNGHGLGLANVKYTIEAHDGYVEVRDRSGGGTRFELNLPLKAKSSSQAKVDSR